MVFITAEIGINHNGSIEIAKKLIKMSKDCGCDAVKFQKRTVEKVYSSDVLDAPRESPWGTTNRDQKLGLEFNKKEYDEIDSYCKQENIEWYASAWDLNSQIFLKEYNLKYNKIASAMLTNLELLKIIAEEKKYTFISTGMSTLEQIDDAESGFALTFSHLPFPGHDLELVRQHQEAEGWWYHSPELEMNGWLCPALFLYFDEAPVQLYARFTSIA